jgi:hypothetical protein
MLKYVGYKLYVETHIYMPFVERYISFFLKLIQLKSNVIHISISSDMKETQTNAFVNYSLLIQGFSKTI